MLRSRPFFTAIGILLSLLAASPARAHQQLRSASPAAGDSLSAAPSEIRLTFAQAVEPSLAELRLMGPGGEVALGDLLVPSGSPAVLAAAIVGELVAGDYTVHWLVTGDDGHPVRGELPFTIREGATGLAAVDSVLADGGAGQAETLEPMDASEPLSAGSPLYVAARWLNFAGIVVVIGAVTFATLLLGRVGRRSGLAPEGLLERARERAALVGLAGGLCLLIALPLRLFAQAAALQGAGGGSSVELVRSILTRSLWGKGWLLAVAAVLITIAGFALARRGTKLGWLLGAVGAIALAVTPALSGHAAATSTAAVISDSVHVLSAGGWLGTLLVMMLAGMPVMVESTTSKRAAAGALVSAFTPIALSFAGLLALTGVYAAWLHLNEVDDLWSSDYGQTLLLKLGALVLVLAAGAYNWRRARPALEVRGDPRPLRRSAVAELAFAALVLAITAALVATPPPRDSAEVARVEAEVKN